jgi:hypothetical protein
MLTEVIRTKAAKMCGRPLTFTDPMGPAGISHETELPTVLDELVDQYFRILIMNIVISRTMDV